MKIDISTTCLPNVACFMFIQRDSKLIDWLFKILGVVQDTEAFCLQNEGRYPYFPIAMSHLNPNVYFYS